MMLDRATSVRSPFGGQVRGVRRLLAREDAEVAVNAASVDPRHPSGWALGDAHQSVLAVGVRATLVLLVDVLRNIPQVFERVVAGVAVYVVKLAPGPIAMDVQPRKAVRPIVLAGDADLGVSAAVAAPGKWLALRLAVRVVPSECTRLRVVVKKFAQTLRGKIGSSHAVVPLKQWFGQRPGSIRSRSRLRYFSGLHAVLHEPNCRHTHRQPSHLRVAFSLD